LPASARDERATRGTTSCRRRRPSGLPRGSRELQSLGGRRAPHAARRRRSAGRTFLRRLHPPPRITDAAQRLQRVVHHRRGENPHDLHRDVLSTADARRAELAALLGKLAASCDDGAGGYEQPIVLATFINRVLRRMPRPPSTPRATL